MPEPVKLEVWTDGASRGNPGPSSIGVTISENGEIIKEISEYIGTATNNVAEYTAILEAAKEVAKLNPEEVEFNADSQLAVRQINGKYKVNNEKLKYLKSEVLKELNKIPKWKLSFSRRNNNKQADLLANRALDLRKEDDA